MTNTIIDIWCCVDSMGKVNTFSGFGRCNKIHFIDRRRVLESLICVLGRVVVRMNFCVRLSWFY